MDSNCSRYKVVSGASGRINQVGTMIGRFCDPSYNDIQLRFADGREQWLRFLDVEKIN